MNSIARSTVVRVRDLPLLADVGVNPDEIGRRQPLVISVSLDTGAGDPRSIADTIDYRRIVAAAEALALTHIPLIETFAARLADECAGWPGVTAATVVVDKPFALTRGLAGVEVTASRMG